MFFYRFLARLINFFTDRAPSFDQKTMLRLLCTATDNNISTSEMVGAMALDTRGARRRRLQLLATRLDQGSSLGLAAEVVPNLISTDVRAALLSGQELGILTPTLRTITNETNVETERSIQKIMDTLVYVGCTFVFSWLICSFLYIKLMPIIQQIIIDFGIEPAESFKTLVAIGNTIGPWASLVLLAIVAATGCLVTGQLSRSLRAGWLANLIRISKLTQTARVLEQIAIARRKGRPVAATVASLAKHHTTPYIRRSMQTARDVAWPEDSPAVWTSLAHSEFISKNEARALSVAEDIGNTSWVLEQMASSRRAKVAGRIQIVAQLLMPILVILLAIAVGFTAWAILYPLFDIGTHIQ